MGSIWVYKQKIKYKRKWKEVQKLLINISRFLGKDKFVFVYKTKKYELCYVFPLFCAFHPILFDYVRLINNCW